MANEKNTSDENADTQQLLVLNNHSRGIKQILILIGILCVCVVFGLFILLREAPESDSNPHYRFARSLSVESPQTKLNGDRKVNLNERNQNKVEKLGRIRRDAVPEFLNQRKKRLIQHLEHLKVQIESCRNAQLDPSECDKIHRDMVVVSQALNEQLSRLGEINEQKQAERLMNNQNVPDLVRQPLTEFNRDHQDVRKVNQFPHFHEDFNSGQLTLWNVDQPSDLVRSNLVLDSMRRTQNHWPAAPIARDNEKNGQIKSPNFDPSGQILQLCDQINRQTTPEQPSQVNNLPGPTSSGFVTNNAHTHNFNQNPAQNFQQQQQQQLGVQQVLYRPCMYQQPMTQVPVGQSLFMPQQQFVPVANPNTNRYVLVNSQQLGVTAPSGQGFVQVLTAPMARSEEPAKESICPHKVTSTTASPISTPSAQDTRQNSEFFDFVHRLADGNVTNPFNVCLPTQTSCIGSNQCIDNEKWCDGEIHCIDASDETSCSCPEHIGEEKKCDGYLDCPMGDDENGCFGCDKHSYSCFTTEAEYQRAIITMDPKCYTLKQKCDGFVDCLTGKDEEDCSMLVKEVGLKTTFLVPYTEGILYRNFQGRWYPVCNNPMEWAREACESEMGDTTESPQITTETGELLGPYISKIAKGGPLLKQQITFTDSCLFEPRGQRKIHVRAKCPQMKCGIGKSHPFTPLRLRVRDENERRKRAEHLRIVGGDRSEPHNWPFIVALYRNGRFFCGGSIYTNHWIITAAHCVSKSSRNYYEVHAGLLRRFSYAPEVQISIVTSVIVNNAYDRTAMTNDLALLRLDKPLLYNRWVRPICLPSPERVSSAFDGNWMFGPPAGTTCTVVGWGLLLEGGTSPDNLEEVNVPIMKSCKDILDINGNEICAGLREGGQDACQGDSGGPLICRSKVDENEFYLAGIVSHGEGCARRGEPGVYTRVALYLDWIEEMINSDWSTMGKPTITKCPGFTCNWSNRCISTKERCNGIVNCLGGEDELNCAFTPVSSTKKRISRQNPDPELPDGGGNSDIPATKSDKHDKHDKNTTEHSTHTNPLKATTTTTSTEPSKLSATTEEATESTTAQINDTIDEHPTILGPDDDATAEHSTKKPGHAKPAHEKPEHEKPEHQKPHHEKPEHEKPLHEKPDQQKPHHEKPAHEKPEHEKPAHEKPSPNEIHKFHCKQTHQTIKASMRCDGSVDCDDGTDEENCSCREILQLKHPQRICDGHINCLDKSDEENCFNCTAKQFKCRFSKQCIPKAMRCNRLKDCAENEDEHDCVALTDGKTELVNLEQHFHFEGVVCENNHGIWSVKCVKPVEVRKNTQLAGQTCFMLGFSGYSFHNVSKVDKNGLIQHPNRGHHNRIPVFNPWSLYDDRLRHRFKRQKPDVLLPKTEEIVSDNHCFALYVKCVPHSKIPGDETGDEPTERPEESSSEHPLVESTTNASEEPSNTPANTNPIKPFNQPGQLPSNVVPAGAQNDTKVTIIDNFSASWAASIFINGELKCVGVLVDRFFVLVDNTCIASVDLTRDLVNVVLGQSGIQLFVQGPYEQINRVDCVHDLKTGGVMLLHLYNGVQYTRHVLPTYLPPNINHEDEDCLAISHGEMGGLISVPIFRSDRVSPSNNSSYYQVVDDIDDIKCTGFDAAKSGVAVCRSEENNTYYPISLFSFDDGLCTFNEATLLELIESSYSRIQMLLDWRFCHNSTNVPECNGHRCPLGECIPNERVCDAKMDCRDGSDEQASLCAAKNKCLSNEMRCGNGTCISKTKFCDKIYDCQDYSDEPAECNCLQYLTVTDSSKICDGIPNCHDKTDEGIHCPCRSNSFRCTTSQFCIPNQFVCDGQHDCPNSEDESECYGVEENINHGSYYRVISRSLGEWQTHCIKKPHKPTMDELKEICMHLGYPNGTHIEYNLIDPEKERDRNYPSSTKVVATQMFSELKLNEKFQLKSIQPSRNTTEFKPWNADDNAQCYQLEINCDAENAN